MNNVKIAFYFGEIKFLGLRLSRMLWKVFLEGLEEQKKEEIDFGIFDCYLDTSRWLL